LGLGRQTYKQTREREREREIISKRQRLFRIWQIKNKFILGGPDSGKRQGYQNVVVVNDGHLGVDVDRVSHGSPDDRGLGSGLGDREVLWNFV
jgi:hypothetical protein